MSPWSQEATPRQPCVPTSRLRTVCEGRVPRGGPIGAGIGKAPGRNEEGIFEKQKDEELSLLASRAGKGVGIHNPVPLKKGVTG